LFEKFFYRFSPIMKDISVIIPAYNEEGNIAAAITSVIAAVREMVDDYEIIVVDDGSADATGRLAEQEARDNPRVKVLRNPRNKGFGCAYRHGLAAASKTYVGVFPGDNDMSALSLRDIIREIGAADVITSYMRSGQKRSLFRRCLSGIFVRLMNGLFGLRLKYYNGSFMSKTALAECLVKLIKAGYSYKEVCFEHKGRAHHCSKALRWKSVWQTGKFMVMLLMDVYANIGLSRLDEMQRSRSPNAKGLK
jgi:glycosyltransferase involved in cell wall biosynthesis